MEQHKPQPVRQPARGGSSALAALILGIALVISAVIVGSNISKLSKTVKEQIFTSPSASNINVASPITTQYMTVKEAAEYVKFPSADEIITLIEGKELFGYVKLSTGDYIIPKEALDKWFETHSTKAAAPENSQ